MKKRVRGIIVDGDKIALIERVKQNNTYYIFPGGGVEEGEDLSQALHREIKEELGIAVSIGDLFAEYRDVSPSHEQMHYFYFCTMTGGVFGTGDGPEYQPGNGYLVEGTHDPVWIPLSKLKDITILPEEIKQLVIEKYALQK